MSIIFTDPRYYVKGLVTVRGVNPATGNIEYFSDKVQTSTVNLTVDMGELRAGLGNPVATMIPSNTGASLELNTADFSMRGVALQTGATLSYGVPWMVCQTVTAAGEALSIDLSNGTPVAMLGMDEAVAYIQTVGAEATIAATGVAYPIDSTGAISGFAATSGVTYKVWYYVNRVNAELATVTTALDGKVLLMTIEMAVFTNVNPDTLAGNRVATVTVQGLFKAQPGGSVGGNQTDFSTTTITMQAITQDAAVITGDCDDCANAGTPLLRIAFVPCDVNANIRGLALVGGVLEVPTNTTVTIDQFRVVLADGSTAPVDPALMTYTLQDPPEGTTVSGSVLTTGASAGDTGEITATMTSGGETYTTVVNLVVTEPAP